VSQQINLFNPIFLKQKKYFSAVTMAQGLGLILIGALAMTGYAAYESIALKREVEASALQLSSVQAQLAQLTDKPRKKNVVLEEGVRKTEAEVKVLQKVFETLDKGELGNTKGYSEYFRAFSRQAVSGLWLTGLTLYGAGNEIGIQGRTLQPELVPEYLGRLRLEETMKGKSFAALEMQLPQDEAPSGGAAPVRARGFIEFRLRSENLPVEKTDGSGEKSK